MAKGEGTHISSGPVLDEDLQEQKAPLPARIVRHIQRDAPLIAIDLGIVTVTYLAGLVVRFGGAVDDEYWVNFWRFIPFAALIHLAVNYAFGLYGRMWQYASVHEARRLLLAGVTAAGLVISASILGSDQLRLVPLSVAVMGTTLSLLGFGGVRFQSRLFALRRRGSADAVTRVLVVGAGRAGSMLVQDIHHNASLGLIAEGFVDDDDRKVGRSVHGVRVLGPISSLPSLISQLGIDEVLLAIPSATSELVRDVSSLCEQANVPLRVLPSVREVIGGRVSVKDVRDLRIEDLLGRQQVSVDVEDIRNKMQGRRILVTGAGGSIGGEIARQLAAYDPSQLLLLDHDETHLHNIVTDVPSASSVLADIRDEDALQAAFERLRPEIVFHAAAHKHVPILEKHPREAFTTNVVGTVNVAKAAIAGGAERFVFISTDKAVRPVSVMGASKSLAEQILWLLLENNEIFCAVRFGNVLGSRGSVIPTFLRQIAQNGPVTITDPSMTRYFMSLDEAAALVLQAAALARGGEVFTLDMGEPINIMELANKLIRLSGRRPGKDIPIEIIGRRPGEKVSEDLVPVGEEMVKSSHEHIFVSEPPAPDHAKLRGLYDELGDLARVRDEKTLAAKMLEYANDPHAAAPVRDGVIELDASRGSQ